MHTIAVDGVDCVVIARTIGGSYAVLEAEQLKASGVKVVLGLTSAGRVAGSLPLPSLAVVEEAIRDEGTSYHYLPPRGTVHSHANLTEILATEVGGVGDYWTSVPTVLTRSKVMPYCFNLV